MRNEPIKIIFVNSFKGGAGKTTLSLSHCISALHETENVIYMDLDLLGTGTRYLFDEKNVPPDQCFDQTGKSVPVKIAYSSGDKILHLAYLSTSFKGHFTLGGAHLIQHQEIAEEGLISRVLSFINEQTQTSVKTLLVLDCAPGFTKMEQKILKECYSLAAKGLVEVEEEYITTLDSAHVQKCIQCLYDGKDNFEVPKKHRNIKVVINDIQNYEGYLREKLQRDTNAEWQKIAEEIRKQFVNMAITLIRWKYSEEIAVKSTYMNERKLENQVDEYILTSGNFCKIDEEVK